MRRFLWASLIVAFSLCALATVRRLGRPNYYSILVLATVAPIIAIPLAYLAVRAHNHLRGNKDAQNLKFWANTLLFLEFVLAVSTSVRVSYAAFFRARDLRDRLVVLPSSL